MTQVISSISGRVIAITAQIGEEVAIGQEVVLVESMKIEIPVESESKGRLKELLVAVGDDVEEGQAVAVLE